MSFAHNTPIQFVPGIGWRTANVMHTLGIHTVGQLHTIPENILVELFGPSIRSILSLVGLSRLSAKQSQSIEHVHVGHQHAAPAKEKPTLRKRLRLATQVMSLL